MPEFEPLHSLFGAEMQGINITAPLQGDDIDRIDRAMDRFGILLIRGQALNQDQQIAFTKQFGPLDLGFKRVAGKNQRLKYDELGDISNLGVDGEVVGRSHKRIVNNLANQLWHSDSSFQRPAARYSMLAAVEVTRSGGETEFADMRAAYDALSSEMKSEIDGLVAEHYALHSRLMLGDDGYDEAQRNAVPPALWPVVRVHPGSGRRHLFIGAHARRIEGLTVPEGRMLLMDLLEHATRRQFVYVHSWQPGDLVIWDNRCILHRGRRFNLSERRELRRSTTLDVDPADRDRSKQARAAV